MADTSIETSGPNQGLVCVEGIDWYPASTAVFVDGSRVGVLGQYFAMSPGDHSLRVSKPLFGSQSVNVQVRQGDKLLFTCQRTWLSKVTAILLIAVVGCFIPGRITGSWYPSTGLALLISGSVLLSAAYALGARWLSLRQTVEGAMAARLHVIYAGPSGFRYMTPSVYVDGRRTGYVGDLLFVSPGPHTIRVDGWTVRSNKLQCHCEAADTVLLNCKETATVWAILAIIAALMTGVFFLILWMINYYSANVAIAVFVGSAVVCAVVCTAVPRFSPTMLLSQVDPVPPQDSGPEVG